MSTDLLPETASTPRTAMFDTSTSKRMSGAGLRTSALRNAALAVIAAAGLAACSSSPDIQSVSIGNGSTYASVGVPLQLTATAHYSDGTKLEVTGGVTWRSSDETVATVDGAGVLTAWKQGTATIAANHPSGLSGAADLTARVVVALRAGSTLPAGGTVDTATSYFHVSGLVPGAMYTPTVSGMTDDVDIAVYSDASLAQSTKLCESITVGATPEACVVPVPGSGELWIVVDGSWTQGGASFSVDVPAAPSVDLAGTLVFPGQLPHSGTIGVTRQFFEVTGLRPGSTYEVRISALSADIDLAVYGDPYEYAALCESIQNSTVDDFCLAKAAPAGELFVEIDGTTTVGGGSYTLSVTAR